MEIKIISFGIKVHSSPIKGHSTETKDHCSGNRFLYFWIKDLSSGIKYLTLQRSCPSQFLLFNQSYDILYLDLFPHPCWLLSFSLGVILSIAFSIDLFAFFTLFSSNFASSHVLYVNIISDISSFFIHFARTHTHTHLISAQKVHL